MKQIIDALEAAQIALKNEGNQYLNTLAKIDAALAAAREQQPVASVTVSGPTGCGKSAIMELIYRALRDAGLHPYSDDIAQERRLVDAQTETALATKVWKLVESNIAQQRSQEPIGFTQRADAQIYAASPAPAVETQQSWALRGYIRGEVERAITEAVNPAGMSVHSGMARIGADKLRYLLNYIDRAAPPVPSDEQQPVAWQLLEDLNLASLERVAAEKEAQGEERIPCFLSVEWVKRAVAAWRAATPAPDAEDAARLAEIREIYAGMEGFVPQTAAEGYCLEIIRKMAHAAMGVQSMADPIQRLHAAVSAYAADDEGLTPLAWNQVRADIAAALRAKDAETARATEGYRIMRAEYDNLERKYDAAEQRAERLAGALRPFAEIALTLDGVPVDFARMVLRARAALDAEESPEPKHQTPENTAGHDIDAEASCLNT